MRHTHILIAPAELTLKSHHTRKKFTDILIHNIKSGLERKSLKYEIVCERGRIIIKTRAIEEASQILKRIFGISHFFVCIHVELNKLEEFVKDNWKKLIDPRKTFAVRVRRVGKHDFTSVELASKLGSYIDAKVNLTNPEQILYVEVRQDDCYVSNKKVVCMGGLPIGTTGKVVVPIMDSYSVLAAWMMMKRGCEIIPLFFSKSKMKSQLKVLKAWVIGRNLRVFSCNLRFKSRVEFGEAECEIARRWVSYRIAEKVATLTGSLALVGSEVIGHHLNDIRVLQFYDRGSSYPVFRPIICFSNDMLNSISRAIGIKIRRIKLGGPDLNLLFKLEMNLERDVKNITKTLEEIR